MPLLSLVILALAGHTMALELPLPDECIALCLENNVASSTLAFERIRSSDCSSFFLSRYCKLPLETAQDTLGALEFTWKQLGLPNDLALETADAKTSALLQQVPLIDTSLESTAQTLSLSFGDAPLGVFAFDSLVSSLEVSTKTPLEELRLPHMHVGTVSVNGELQRAELSGSTIDLASSITQSLNLDLSHTETLYVRGVNPNMTMPVPSNVTVIPSTKGTLSYVSLSITSPFAADANVGHLVKAAFCAPETQLASHASVHFELYHDDILPLGLPNETYTEDMLEGLQCLVTRLASDATESVDYRLEMKGVSDYWNGTHVVAAWRDFFETTFLQPLQTMSPALPSSVMIMGIPPAAQVLLDKVTTLRNLFVVYKAGASGWPDRSQNKLSGIVSASKLTQLEKIVITLQDYGLKQLANGGSNLELRLCSLNFASVLDWGISTSTNICPLLASVFVSFEDAVQALPDELAFKSCPPHYWDQFLFRTTDDIERRNCRASFNTDTGLSVALKPSLSTTVMKYRRDNDVASVRLQRLLFPLERFELEYPTQDFVALDSETSKGIECRLTGVVGNGTVLQHTVPVNTSGFCDFELPGLDKLTRFFNVEIDLRNASANGTFAKLLASAERRWSFVDVVNQLDLQRRGDWRNGKAVHEDIIVFSIGISKITAHSLFGKHPNKADYMSALEVDVHLSDGVTVTLQPEQCLDDNKSSYYVRRFCIYKLTSQHGLDLLDSHKSLCDTPSNKVVVYMPRLHTLADLPGSNLTLRLDIDAERLPPSPIEILRIACPKPTSTLPDDDVSGAAVGVQSSLAFLLPALASLLSSTV
ncbi:MAG: hypothetical protein MHM6MM_003353 [Cercozoa sp. M6MM]